MKIRSLWTIVTLAGKLNIVNKSQFGAAENFLELISCHSFAWYFSYELQSKQISI